MSLSPVSLPCITAQCHFSVSLSSVTAQCHCPVSLSSVSLPCITVQCHFSVSLSPVALPLASNDAIYLIEFSSLINCSCTIYFIKYSLFGLIIPRKRRRYSDKKTSDKNRKEDLKVAYHPLYSLNKFASNKSKLPQDGAQVFPYLGGFAIM